MATLLGLPLLIGLSMLWPVFAQAQDTIVSHSITTFGEPSKYPADFTHLTYVNPDAPKGGEISVATFGTFDTMNPYSQKGRAGALSNIAYEDMMTGTADEIGALYCLICETLEYPPTKEWAIFTIRPEARFSDGTPITADDILFTYEIFLKEGLISFRTVLAQFVEKVEVLAPDKVKYTFKTDSTPRERVQMAGSMPPGNAFGSKFGSDASASTSPLRGSIATTTPATGSPGAETSRKPFSAASCRSTSSVSTARPPERGSTASSTSTVRPATSTTTLRPPKRPRRCGSSSDSTPDCPTCSPGR